MRTAGLTEILRNTTFGASTLYKQTLQLLISDRLLSDKKRALHAVRQLRKAFPAMAVFVYLEERLLESRDDDVAVTARRLLKEADGEIDSIFRRLGRFWRTKRRVITISHSSAVESMILRNRKLVTSVALSVSSPQNEGIELARLLARQDIRVTITADAALPGMIQPADLILLGADCVTESLIVNKIGSYALALAAREKRAECIVVAESFKKISSERFPFKLEVKPPGEIAAMRLKNVTVCNYYFETVPIALIDRVIVGHKGQ